jgi:thymidylate synthase
MNIADKYFIETLKELKNTSNVDVNPRAKYKDGTPANTKFITQKTFTYDISKGEFPINTLRNTAIKEGFKEIQWIYQEQSNSKNSKYFPKWWQEWLNKEGNLGTAYAHNINDIDIYDTNSREVVNIEKRLLPLECSAIIPIPIVNNILTSVDGKVYQSEIGKGFIIVDKK